MSFLGTFSPFFSLKFFKLQKSTKNNITNTYVSNTCNELNLAHFMWFDLDTVVQEDAYWVRQSMIGLVF